MFSGESRKFALNAKIILTEMKFILGNRFTYFPIATAPQQLIF